MSATVEIEEQTSEEFDTAFFAPTQEDAIDGLIASYKASRSKIMRVSDFIQGEDMTHALSFFFDAQRKIFDRIIPDPARVFDSEAAIKALDAHYWSKALAMTDVMDYMPSARRDQWNKQIQDMDCPTFDEQTVRDNLQRLLAQRMDFLAEMVEGLFYSLSSEHVTNRPEGFSKRMIIDQVNAHSFGGGRKRGYLHDLRTIMAKLMGRDQPHLHTTETITRHAAFNTGQWCWMDGHAFRLRVYYKGTAHMEVNPAIAYRLNQILAHRNPTAIPARFRKPPQRRSANVELMQRPLPFQVINALSFGSIDRIGSGHKIFEPGYYFTMRESGTNAMEAIAEAGNVVEALGGVREYKYRYRFEYDPERVINEVVATGAVPDDYTHQFYPTPDELADEMIRIAEIEPHHRCLEPEAGTGHLARRIHALLTCVEVSALRVQTLVSQGFDAVKADFLEWKNGYFDRIVMNPPFSKGRAVAHVQHAAQMLSKVGRLVSIVPSGLVGHDFGLGDAFRVTFSSVYENAFKNASVNVVIVKIERR